jgi:hypothetical protein
VDVNNPATLDEKVAMVVDVLQAEFLDGDDAVTVLREATGLCPVICAGLLVRESIRRNRDGDR